MKRMTMKGGEQHSIEAVLGDSFKDIIGRYEAGGKDASFFECKNAKSRPRGAADDDISPLFIQFFSAAIREFHWMESPDPEKPSFTRPDVQEKFKTVFKPYFSSGKNKTPLDTQPIINLKQSNVKFLSNGLSLIDLTEDFPLENSNYNTYEKIVAHLYKYISLLDIKDLKGYQVIEVLKADTNSFMKLINALVNDIKGDLAGISEDQLRTGLLGGFGAVADKIIKVVASNDEVHSLPEKNNLISLVDTVTYDLTGTALTTEVEDSSTPTSAASYKFKYNSAKNALTDKIATLKKFHTPGTCDTLYDNTADALNAAKQTMWNYRLLDGRSIKTNSPADMLDPAIRQAAISGGGRTVTYGTNWTDFFSSTSTFGTLDATTGPARAALKKKIDDGFLVNTAAVKAELKRLDTGIDNAITATGILSLGLNGADANTLYNAVDTEIVISTGAPAGLLPEFLYSDKRVSGINATYDGKLLLPIDEITTAPGITALVDSKSVSALKTAIEAIRGAVKTKLPPQIPQRAFSIGLVAALTELNLDGNANHSTTSATQNNIRTEIKKFLDAYEKVYSRGKGLESRTSLLRLVGSTQDVFHQSLSLALGTQVAYTQTTGAFGAKTPAGQKKTLRNYANFYKNHVAKDPEFYDKFFNLLKKNGNSWVDNWPSGGSLKTVVQESDYDNYRLNVKKLSDLYGKLMRGQTGGADDDIVIVSYVPKFGAKHKIFWIKENDKVEAKDVVKSGMSPELRDAWQQVFRMAYLQQTDEITLTLADGNTKKIEVKKFMDSIRDLGVYPYDVDLKKLFNDMLAKKLERGVTGKMDKWWTEFDNKLRESAFKASTEWVREGNVYVRKDSKGKELEWAESDSCEFTNLQAAECDSFVKLCLDSKDPWSSACSVLLDNPKEINIAITDLAKKISEKVNPGAAAIILEKYGFELEDGAENDPVRGLHIYKVQPVSKWLAKLLNNPQAFSRFGDDAQKVKDLIEKGANKTNTQSRNFLNYLSVLVDWVNAHPEIHNKELRYGKPSGATQPDADKSFKSFRYFSPYRSPRQKLYEIGCGLDRLKSSIYNKLMGADGDRVLSNVVSTPLDLEMPFGRIAHTYQYPRGLKFRASMLGGAGDDEMDEMVTHAILNDIYKNILGTMGEMGDKRLKGSSQREIQKALDTIKQGEQAYRESIKSLIAKYKLYRASHGRIDPYNIEDSELPELLKKHSNLFHLSQALNKHSIRLIDVLRTLVKIVEEKEQEKTKEYKTYPMFGETAAPAPAPAPVASRKTDIITGGSNSELSPKDTTHPFTIGTRHASVADYVGTQPPADILKATKAAYVAQLTAHPGLVNKLKGTRGPITFVDPADLNLGDDGAGNGQNIAGKVLLSLRNNLESGLPITF